LNSDSPGMGHRRVSVHCSSNLESPPSPALIPSPASAHGDPPTARSLKDALGTLLEETMEQVESGGASRRPRPRLATHHLLRRSVPMHPHDVHALHTRTQVPATSHAVVSQGTAMTPSSSIQGLSPVEDASAPHAAESAPFFPVHSYGVAGGSDSETSLFTGSALSRTDSETYEDEGKDKGSEQGDAEAACGAGMAGSGVKHHRQDARGGTSPHRSTLHGESHGESDCFTRRRLVLGSGPTPVGHPVPMDIPASPFMPSSECTSPLPSASPERLPCVVEKNEWELGVSPVAAKSLEAIDANQMDNGQGAAGKPAERGVSNSHARRSAEGRRGRHVAEASGKENHPHACASTESKANPDVHDHVASKTHAAFMDLCVSCWESSHTCTCYASTVL